MELKYYQPPVKVIANFGSNRTFMELKFAQMRQRMLMATIVLIAPLWN